MPKKDTAEKAVRDIRHKTRRRFSAEEFRRESADSLVTAFLSRAALERRNDFLREAQLSEDRVRVMTVHSAKGTESPVVILVGIEDGNFPHYYAAQESRLDEERRSFYVAMTGAEEVLVLSHALTRSNRYGKVFRKERWVFLEEALAEASSA